MVDSNEKRPLNRRNANAEWGNLTGARSSGSGRNGGEEVGGEMLRLGSSNAAGSREHPSGTAASTVYGTVDQAEGRGVLSPPVSNGNGGEVEEHEQCSETLLEKEEKTERLSTLQAPPVYLAAEDVAFFNPDDTCGVLPAEGGEKGGKPSPMPVARRKGSGLNWTFRGRSPKFIRFQVLILITLLPFGAHFTKSCFSSLEVFFLHDPGLKFNETKYGALVSSVSIPNLFMPFFGGLLLDAKGHKQGIVLFLMITLVGHLIFTLAMAADKFWMAIVGEVIHGLGSGTVSVAMRAIVSKFFLENELTFALGVTVSGACISKALAKASVAPIAETRFGYMGALWYVALWQLLSLCAGFTYVRLAQSAHLHLGMEAEKVQHADLRPRSLFMTLKRSTLTFWVVAVLHTLFLTAYHLFANFSGHFIVENYEVSPVLAGYMSSLQPLVVVFFAPLAGLVLDYWGGQIYVLLLTNIVTIAAYFLLWQKQAGAVVCIVMLALCESFVPTILLSALPVTVDQSVYGVAFGIAEVISAFATIVSNVYFGYSRDQTSSYHHDLAFILWICLSCLVLTVFLLYWDARYGGSRLNLPRKDSAFMAIPSLPVTNGQVTT